MIFIVVKFPVKPEYAEKWLDLTRDFTEATRAEPGNKWFEWSRSVEDPNEFVLVEAFEDDGAAAHVNSAHFAQAMTDMRPALRATPKIVSEHRELAALLQESNHAARVSAGCARRKSCKAVFTLKMVIVHTKISTGVMDELITTLRS